MEVLQMYDPDTGKKKYSRLRAIVRLFMRLHMRWNALTQISKTIMIATILLSVFGIAFYSHSTFASSTQSSDEWRRQLGRAAWHFLHTTAAQLPDKENITATHLESFRSIFRSLEVIYPCEECREHLVLNMKRMRGLDTIVDAPSALVWTCELHNIVNEAQKKPLFPCDPEILAKKWSNPNCGCRSKKSESAFPSHAPSQAVTTDPSPAAVQNDALHTRSPQADTPAKSLQAKADAIAKAQAKLASDTAAGLKPPVKLDVMQDSAAQHVNSEPALEQDVDMEPVPDTVLSPEEEET